MTLLKQTAFTQHQRAEQRLEPYLLNCDWNTKFFRSN